MGFAWLLRFRGAGFFLWGCSQTPQRLWVVPGGDGGAWGASSTLQPEDGGTGLGGHSWCFSERWLLLGELSPPAPPDGIRPGSGAGVAVLPRPSRAAALQKCQLFITLARLLWNNLSLPAAGPSQVGCPSFPRPWDRVLPAGLLWGLRRETAGRGGAC